jgi:hypothetical protein
VEDGRGQVFGANSAIARLGADAVAGTVDDAAADAGAGQAHAEDRAQ